MEGRTELKGRREGGGRKGGGGGRTGEMHGNEMNVSQGRITNEKTMNRVGFTHFPVVFHLNSMEE